VIVELGRWVLREACTTLADWRRADPDLRMAVNVSARQLREASLVEDVVDALAAADLPPEALLLEVTESILLDDLDGSFERLQALKRLGVGLALDDFGTGYSSLSYLGRYPFDQLKIDRSFVEGAALRPDAAAVVRAIVELGRNLGMDTVAEGVETPAQAMLLSAMGCGAAQGYLFSRPVPAAEAALLVGQPCRPHSVLPLPAQRPERGSSGSVGSDVHGMQPIDV
jgi:EAL domain-containing protein (putative c-di-GMP-specific phosphodiesterase class I)